MFVKLMNQWAKRSTLLLLFFLIGYSLSAQDFEFVFGGKVTEFNEKKQKDLPVDAANITLLQNGSSIASQTTDRNGKFKIRVPANGEYIVTVTKSGYITKRFAISTRNIPVERATNPFSEFDVEIEIFQLYPGLDYSVLNKPIARITYNPAPDVDDFDYDKVYAEQMRSELERLKELARQAREKERLYNAAIDRADKLFNASDWNGAKAAYQEALTIKPDQQYPKDQIAKCDEKLASAGAAAANDQKYKDLIAQADQKFNSKDYAGAKSTYQQALGIKPAEQYPKDQIAKCDKAVADAANAAANEQKYKDLITQADQKFAAKDWAGAKGVYTQALAIKSAEQYPKDQIAKCDKAIADEANAAANEQKYKDLIAQADQKFAAKDWAGAKGVYTQALAIKSAEQYPKDQIAKCDKAIADDANAAANEKKYQDLIKDADQKFAAKDWAGSKGVYTQALALKSAEQYPKDQIAKCDKAIADDANAAANEKKYQDLIKDADQKFAAKNWAGAKGVYTQASALKATEQYPKDQIAKCDQNLDAEKASAELDKKYKDAIARGDKAMTAKDYASAKTAYTEATGLKSAEQYPKDKLAEIEKLLADKANAEALDKQYKELITQADQKFTAKDWAGAKAIYTQAAALKTTEQYPKDRIKACDDNLAKDAAAAETDKKYNDAIARGDKAFADKDYASAKVAYTEASGLKPTEKYPKDKLKEIEKLLLDKANADAQEKKYQDLISQADQKFNASDWAGAKGVYTQAAALKATEQYPKDQIAKCDKNIADAANAANDKKYQDLIAQADQKFEGKDWAGAKGVYTQALAIKAGEQYPKDQIAKCDASIAADKSLADQEKKYQDALARGDKAMTAKTYEAAKAAYTDALAIRPNEQYPKDKLAEIEKILAEKAGTEALNKQYKDLITQADQKFTAKDWAGARGLYEQASNLKSTEQYPKDRIKLCDENLAKDLNAKEIDEKYKNAIAKGDGAFNNQDYETAQSAYTEASGLKPTEKYPKDQLAEIKKRLAAITSAAELDRKYKAAIAKGDSLFGLSNYATAKTAYASASALKATEQYPKDKMAECDRLLADQKNAEKDKQYTDLIAQGDAAFGTQDYGAAKVAYTSASKLKPTEQYPKDKLAEIEKLMADKANAAAMDKKYNDAIARGDKAMTAKTYAAAKTAYNEALAIKPNEQYPKDKLAEIEKLLADQANAEQEKKYTDAIARGDQAMTAKNYVAARTAYTEASGLKPTEQYPKDKLAEIEKLLGDKAAQDALNKQYNDLIAKADKLFAAKDWTGAKTTYQEASAVKSAEQYPKDQIAKCDENMAKSSSAAELDAKYSNAIAKADLAFNSKDYEAAKAGYNEALGYKPNEAYPKQKLAEIARLENAAANENAKDRAYRELLQKGDSLFGLKEYAAAKLTYQAAVKQKPADQYPKDKITEIDRLLADQKFEAEKNKKYDALIVKADKQFAAKDYKTAKATYQEALMVKPIELYPKQKIAEIDKILNPVAVNNNPTDKPKAGSDEYINDLVKKYPQGLTEEQSKEGNITTIQRVVVVGNKGWMYTKKVYAWGGVYYFKDGVQISEATYNFETSPAYIQQMQGQQPK